MGIQSSSFEEHYHQSSLTDKKTSLYDPPYPDPLGFDTEGPLESAGGQAPSLSTPALLDESPPAGFCEAQQRSAQVCQTNKPIMHACMRIVVKYHILVANIV